MEGSPGEVSWPLLAMSLAGGLTLFLLGMAQITGALKALSGTRLRSVLARLSSNRVSGAATGAVTTAVLQSSSVTTVLAIGFVSAKLFALPQAAAVIIGSNVGTTLTAQVVALNVADFSLGIVAIGGIATLLARSDRSRSTAAVVVGIGLVFLGLEAMKLALLPLRESQMVLDAMSGLDNVWLALVVGAIIAAVIQSSTATTGIAVVVAGTGLLSLPAGIAVVLGANIGTCVTAVLAALGHGREAMRAATIHVLVNLLGAVLWVFFIDQLAHLVEWMAGTAGAHDSATPRELANAHTIFNIANAVVFLALLSPLVWLARRIIPITTGEEEHVDPFHPSFSDDPAIVIDHGQESVGELTTRVEQTMSNTAMWALGGSSRDLDSAMTRDRVVGQHYERLVEFLAKAENHEMSAEQLAVVRYQVAEANIVRAIGSAATRSAVLTGQRRIRDAITVSPVSRQTLEDCAGRVAANYTRVSRGETPEELSHEFQAVDDHLAERLRQGSPGRSYAVEVVFVFALRELDGLIGRWHALRAARVEA